MKDEKNLQVVQDMLAAQKRRDTACVLDALTEDVEWRGSSDVTGSRSLRGREEVGGLFTKIFEDVEILDSKIEDYIAQGDKVVILGQETFRLKATGRTLENHYAIVYTVRDGKIARCQAYDDTAVVAAAFSE
jgi:ketosteroid isomerase-like protein